MTTLYPQPAAEHCGASTAGNLCGAAQPHHGTLRRTHTFCSTRSSSRFTAELCHGKPAPGRRRPGQCIYGLAADQGTFKVGNVEWVRWLYRVAIRSTGCAMGCAVRTSWLTRQNEDTKATARLKQQRRGDHCTALTAWRSWDILM